MIDLRLTQCPQCKGDLRQADLTSIICSGCNYNFPVVDGIPVLKLDVTVDTALDFDQYEIDHPSNAGSRAKTFEPYRRQFDQIDLRGGSCLEIGSGTGNLTDGLLNSSEFSQIHCSDISPVFLNRLISVLGKSEKLKCWIFDAGTLPFKSNSMDAVVGHSVLHHLLHYEITLAEVHRVLKPGGLAMFGEPIMDSMALTSFIAATILALETANPTGFSSSEIEALRAVGLGMASIGRRMREDRDSLSSLEDKHVYVISDMQKLAKGIGFTSCDYENAALINLIGKDHKWRLFQILNRYGGTLDKLKPYQFLFSALSETYGAAMGEAAPFNFGYFIMRKSL